MKYKKELIFICFIICMLSMASVCASEVNDTYINQNDLKIDNQDNCFNYEKVVYTEENLENNLISTEDSLEDSNSIEPSDSFKHKNSLNEGNSAERLNPEIDVALNSIHVNETAEVNVTVRNASGYVLVSVDDQSFNKDLTDYQAKFNITGLGFGNHNIAVYYGGDDNYLPGFKLETLFVEKNQTQISNIEISEVYYGGDAIIEVSVPDGVEGDITIKINDTLQTMITEAIHEGMALFSVSGLAVGSYSLDATYNGNDYYENDTASAEFEVKKADPNLSVVSFECTVYDNATILASINEEIHDEFVNITVGDEKYEDCPIEDYGMIAFIGGVLSNFSSYRILIEYGGNENFESAMIEAFVTPKKITTYGLDIIAQNISINDDEIISVVVPDHVDDVVVWVDGQSYRNCSFENNVAVFNVTGLGEGVYTVTATVNDTEFDHKNFTSIFTVSKVLPSIGISINETEIYVGDNVKIIVILPIDVSENVSIVFDDRELSEKPVDGNATFYIDCLSYGNKSVPAIYYGDEKYRTAVESINFTVNKVPSFLNVAVENISISDNEVINFSLANDASGNITVIVNDETYIVAVSGGKGTLTVPKLNQGVYSVNASYNGDGKYLPSLNNSESFKVLVNSGQMEIIDERNNTVSVYLWEGATGNLSVKIDGKVYNATVVDGFAQVVISNASYGAHHAYVLYEDNESDLKLESVVDVFVPKYLSPIGINSSILKVGDIGYINVTVPMGASGNISLEIDGKSYLIAIDNGIAEFEVENLTAGDKTIFVKYSGDKAYSQNSTSESLTVFKQESSTHCSIEDISVGDVAQIKITGPSDVLGTVIVIINGSEYTASISNGEGILNVYNLQNGDYDIELSYLENSKYLSSEYRDNLSVSKIQTAISSSNIICQYNYEKYLIAILKDIKGNPISCAELSIDCDGVKNLVSDVNGQIKIPTKDLDANNYSVLISFEGDEKYLPSNASVNVTVNKDIPHIIASNLIADYKSDDYLLIRLEDSQGNPLAGFDLSIALNGLDGDYNDYSTNSKGIVKVPIKDLAANDYIVSIVFNGSANYDAINSTVKVTVEKALSSLFALDLVTVHESDDYMIIALKDSCANPLVGFDLSVDLNGIDGDYSFNEVYSTDSNGMVKVSTKDLDANTYDVKVKFDGNENYTESNITGSIIVREDIIIVPNASIAFTANDSSVSAILSNLDGAPISNASLDISVNGDESTLITDANGRVAIKINGNSTVIASYKDENNLSTTGYLNVIVKDNITEVIVEKNNTIYVNQTVEVPVYINQTVEVPVYVNVTPNRTATKIVYKNMTTVAVAKVDGRVGEYFYVSLKDAKGNPLANKLVQIGFNGRVYNRTTNASGGVGLQINLGNEGKYTFAICFLGDDNYTGSFEVALITVNKHSPKLTAPAKSFKASAKTKSLTATFKSSNGNPISGKKLSFTVNGKTYTGTTNAKGVATVKISLNKKGTYSCTVKYAGDTMYKATTTKFNVKIV